MHSATDENDRFLSSHDLDASYFACCGNQDPKPYKCATCGLPHVFCGECNTVYSGLPDTTIHNPDVNHFDPTKASHQCQRCNHAFEYSFLRNRKYGVTRAEWRAAGLTELLLEALLRITDAKLPPDVRSIAWRDPWIRVEPRSFTNLFANQLRPGHPLHNRPVIALALNTKTEHALFYLPEGPEQLAVVHMNWSPAAANDSAVLPTHFFASAREWLDSL